MSGTWRARRPNAARRGCRRALFSDGSRIENALIRACGIANFDELIQRTIVAEISRKFTSIGSLPPSRQRRSSGAQFGLADQREIADLVQKSVSLLAIRGVLACDRAPVRAFVIEQPTRKASKCCVLTP
jgi:hypothetical protein